MRAMGIPWRAFLPMLLVIMALVAMPTQLSGCATSQEADVADDAAEFNATYDVTKAGIDQLDDADRRERLYLILALRAERIKRRGGVITVEVYDPTPENIDQLIEKESSP